MGRIVTPKYAVRTSGYVNFTETPYAWKGRIPSVEQLERFVMAGVVSTMPGFVNEAIGKAYGLQIPSKVQIVENRPNGRVMVEWKAPMFIMLPEPSDYPEVAKAQSFAG